MERNEDIIIRRLNGEISYRITENFNRCFELQLKGRRIQKIEANIFNGFNRLEKLHLESNEIHTIENGAFDNLECLRYLALHQDCLQIIDTNLLKNLQNLRTLYFSLNKIRIIEAEAFDGLTRLEVLYLNNNYLIDLPENIFITLSNLTELKLSGNYITELKSGLFSNLSKLKILFLPHNKIRKIENGCFRDLKNLKVLNLNDNQLEILDNCLFERLLSLEELWVNFNKIEKIEIRSFANLRNLKLLYLRGNLLNHIDDPTFENLIMLEKLYLDKNRLNSLDSDVIFKNLKALKSIDLSFNQITNVNPNLFNGLNKLKSICLYYNKLDFIGFNQNLNSIKEIQLDNCQIIDFDVSKLISLNKLVLYNNRIEKLEKKQFQNLKNLSYLYLFGNQIKDIDENAFQDLISLKELVLSSNRLNKLTSNIFKSLNSLEKLYLFNNNLTELKPNEFIGLHSLQGLYLFGNSIDKIHINAFSGLTKLKTLILNNNLIDDDEWFMCESLEALKILDLASNKISKLGKNCLNSLVNLNLFNNNIKEIRGEFFERLNSLELVYLENNLIENIHFFNYICRSCPVVKKLFLKNNRIVNFSQEEHNLLMMILNNRFIEISLDNHNGNNHDEILRINKFNIENTKKYYLDGNCANSFFEYFQYLSDGKSIRFTDLQTKLRMLSIITGDQRDRRSDFLKLIQNQNQKENFIILRYIDHIQPFEEYKLTTSPENSPIYQIISEENLNEYTKAVSVSMNAETNSNLFQTNIEQKIGHTAEFKHIFERDMHNFEFSKSLKETEIKFLIEKVSRNNIRNMNQLKEFLKRQILKKIYFNDLYILINLDIKYDQEIDNINKYLIENNFKYSIMKSRNTSINMDINEPDIRDEIKLYEIELVNLESKYRINLKNLNKTDWLRLFLLLLKRDRDLVKVNMDNFYQILLIDELDYACDNDIRIFDEAITYIRNNLINFMNIQVIATISNNEIIGFNNDCFLELDETDKAMNQLSLKKFETSLNQSIKKQNELFNERKKVIYESTINSQIQNFKNENLFLKQQIDTLKNSNSHLQNQIIVLSEENKELKKVLEFEKQTIKETVIICEAGEMKLEDSTNYSNEVASYLSNLNLKREDADKFIEILEQQRKSINGIAKDIICGSIKNLASNLYSSSTHYLHEILQNFEDAHYDHKHHKPLVKIYFDRSCIIFANNEIGFTPNDVNSLCSLSVSQKLLNTHIGNKGIGFKSSFLCTNNPIIISKPAWKFQFNLNEKNMLSYITPRLVSDDDIDDVFKKYLKANESLTTYMCFKFKEYYDDQYFKHLLDIIDINILLFTNNIDELVIENQINGENIVLKRQWKVENENFGDNIKVINVVLFKNEKIYGKYRVFKKIGTKKSDEIVFAFPLDSCMKNNFSLYSTFPINIDLKLNFLISSYWNLATNRESVNEYNRDNLLLRKKLFDMFNYILQKDDFISLNLINYLPVFNANASIWWQSFLNEFVTIIKPFIEDTYCKIRIFNENINKLADRNVFELIDIQVIDKQESKNLHDYGIKELSVKDLLKLLQSNDPKIVDWYNLKDDEWFESFFYLLKISNSFELKNDLLLSKIFLVDSKRQSIENSVIDRIFLFNPQKTDLQFICSQHNLMLLNYLSISEKKFLLDFLHVTEINEDKLFNVILDDHFNHNFSKETLLNDMKFIMENFQLFKQYLYLREEEFLLCVPVKEKEFSLIEESTIPTIFALDFSSTPGIPLVDMKINYNFIDYQHTTLKQSLEYEFFYLDLMQSPKFKRKCKLPEVNIQLLKEKINLQDPQLPLLDIINNPNCEKTEVILATKIFKMLPEEFIKTIVYLLPVKNDNGKIFAISETKLSINMSNIFLELAMLFGATKVPADTSNIKTPLEVVLNEEPNNIDLNRTIDFEKLRQVYIQRIKSQDLFKKSSKERKELNKIFNFEENMQIGIKAEYYFYLYLQSITNDTLNIEECWISSLRKFFHESNKNCNDSIGFDFKMNVDESSAILKFISDQYNLISPHNSKVFYFEVKGFSNEWEDFFILTKNEFKKASELNADELYLIVVIENVCSNESIQIAKIINWTADENKIERVDWESFKYKYKSLI